MPIKNKDYYVVRYVNLQTGTFTEKEISADYIERWLENREHIQIFSKVYSQTIVLGQLKKKSVS